MKKKKECFTCNNKISTTLTKEERVQIKKREVAKGNKYPRVPEMIFHCSVSNKRISQIDPACEFYEDNEDLVDIRKALSVTAKKLRKELNSL